MTKEMISEAIKTENNYRTAFSSLRSAEAIVPGPSWLERLRESAMDRFDELGFPAVTEEEWKYTNVGQIARNAFNPVVAGPDSHAKLSEPQLAQFTYQE